MQFLPGLPTTMEEVHENLLPRRYQEEIFCRAQEGNVIAALDTGSGKTFISTLLIKWIAARDFGQGKVIVFLVPKVALVEQQGNFISKQTPLRVTKCYGAMAIDLSDRARWKKEFDNSDVLVMTAQIFLNILTHSHWSMDKVSLLVFDECHHCRKNHAYNGIMREYFQCSSAHRPKIFGMTASPIWNPKDAVESLATLERNMDAKVIAVREHVDELLDHSPRPKEIIQPYPPSPESYDSYPTPTLWNRLQVLNLPDEMEIPWDKIQTRYAVTYHSLGPYGAELYLYSEMRQRITQLVDQTNDHAHNGDPDYTGMDIDGLDNAYAAQFEPELRQISAVLSDYTVFFGEDDSDPDKYRVPFSLEWCSPKFKVLVDLLIKHYTTTFQGIIFVEQRHVAACLAKVLLRVPYLQGFIKSAELIGHGATSVAKSQLKGMALKTQQDVVKSFRDKEVNLLIATSVAEEGLDFPACDVVVRFDPIQHMVGYVQSRGRARHQTSTFVIMVQENHAADLARYRAFAESEPEMKRVYQRADPVVNKTIEEDEDDEREDPADLAERERYVVPSTGAILTYNSAISLLNHLCSLIPRDRFTPVHLPKYSGDFQATLELPLSLPLPPDKLTYNGPVKRSKKEAKRAVAFMAVMELHHLNVFDDYLLPAKSSSGADTEDADGRPILDVSEVPETMDVIVRDPFIVNQKMWLHVVTMNGKRTAGLVTGTQLPLEVMKCDGYEIRIHRSMRVIFNDEQRQRQLLQDYMKQGVWWCITARSVQLPLSAFLVPLREMTSQPDWCAMEHAVLHPYGNPDWTSITQQHQGRLLVVNSKDHGRPLMLRRIRRDLTPRSKPPKGSREGCFPTYRDYVLHLYTRKGIPPEVPEDGPLLEVQPFPRHSSGLYALHSLGQEDDSHLVANVPNAQFVPQEMCRWIDLTEEMYHTFHVLPKVLHRISDVYRARRARSELGLPAIRTDLLIEAYTLPSANAGFSNQRLETLGDSVLKLCTVVHLFNKFPHRHEGQLDILRRNSVSNRTLLARAKENGLEHYLTSEAQSVRTWRYAMPEGSSLIPDEYVPRSTVRRYPRRSLQDCMEATLGAGFIMGGVPMALVTGTTLGLCLGGPLPWTLRYSRDPFPTPVPPLFTTLQDTLGYEFHRSELLVEAVTHPSFRSAVSSSYQRLEFLGDALIDLVVMHYLFRKFPQATSGQLSWARSRAVCAPALASVAVKKLSLHQILLVNNVELSMAISKYVPVLEETTPENIVNHGWKHDPPKALSDVLESVMGAILVDSAYDYDRASVIAEAVMQDVLEVLSPDLPRDPVSELMISTARAGCRKMSYRKASSNPDSKRNDSISVIVHEIVIVGPVSAANLSLAKGRASEEARTILQDPEHEHYLPKICQCAQALAVDSQDDAEQSVDEDLKALDDETEEGFALMARKKLVEMESDRMKHEEDVEMYSGDDSADERTVEEMILNGL
ncbi:P-loop containing nucleoside triphosphate hydrolase protein [Neolentinus lepideus HHB14362 ss-1]|uniref:p-loop containing nucleoside triphosphate hydrolase protein n=1 Tax=Neolentinus lepideus HHB14362 ss-1 TaxID=1314782 RepID=A0A165RNS1_9AGAM|nr:P-loop containing nucleoside triphosphate hydrolase protein [Neolentinus lepideus HHB14362 ss-1]